MNTQYIRNILIVNNKQYGKSELIEWLIEFCNRSMGYGDRGKTFLLFRIYIPVAV